MRTQRIGFLLFTGLVFSCGVAIGYVLRWSLKELAPVADRRVASGGPGRERPRIEAGGETLQPPGDSSREDRGPTDREPGPFPEDMDRNPFEGRPADELMDLLEQSAGSKDFRAFKMAAVALGDLDPAQVARLSEMLLSTVDPKAADLLAHELVRYGGKEGLLAVSRLARDERIGIEMRARALEAMADISPERRGEAIPVVAEILASGLPQKLQFHAAHIYGRLLGPDAVQGLMDMLETGSVRPEPLVNAMRDFARAEDVPSLAQLLTRTSDRESQECLLRAIGSAAGPEGPRLLQEYLQNPPQGVRREAVGWALDEFARKEDLPGLWQSLESEENRQVQAALARAIARTGGQEEIEKLLKLAGDPASGFSQDALARALSDTAGKDTMPILIDLLGNARSWESSEPLAHGIARSSGREGIDQLLALVEQGGSEERRRAIIQAVEDFGDPSYVERLSELFAGEKDQGVSFHLAKAILRLDPARGNEAIASRLADLPDPAQRAAVAQVLEKDGNAAFLPAIGRVLRAEVDERAQWQMARTMASYGDEGLAGLGEILSADPDPRRRASILRGASSVQTQGLAGISLRLFREDPSPDVRASAAKILGRSGDSALAQDLQSALSSETDPRVREAIEVSLKELTRR